MIAALMLHAYGPIGLQNMLLAQTPNASAGATPSGR